ncbi:MAG: hypothetical protein LBE12_08220 [Planctomycetaceae bacterium]|nr:hypothetical protein [Planctomycetaceae bacterium]
MTPISVVIFTIIGSILLMLFTVQMVLINLNRIVAVLYAVLNGPANIVTGCFELILS